MNLSYRMRLTVIVVGIVVMTAGGLLVKKLLLPESWGVYGHYRADAIAESAAEPIRHGTNASCFSCHPYEAGIHKKGLHKTISCEFCHGTYADHVEGGKKSMALPVKRNEEITTLCLRCHNSQIKARAVAVIKTVGMPDHLEKQKVKTTHTCNQCHHVHAPMKYINRARQITGMKEASI